MPSGRRRRLLAFSCLVLAGMPSSRPIADQIAEAGGIRFGSDDAGRTRVVVDVDQQIGYSATVARLPPGLVISLPDVRWRLEDGPPPRPHGLALGFIKGSTGQGRAWLVVKMRRPVRIARQLILKPSQNSQYHRVVIDVEEEPAGTTPTPIPTTPRSSTTRPAAPAL
jgi:hypothetical protein